MTEPLLLLQSTFATRQILDSAFQVARLHPYIALESSDPHCLLTLADAGHGVAVVPSTLLLPRGLRVAPIVDEKVSLGFWTVVCWDSRRFLPPYGERFATELVEHTRRGYPGKQFDRIAPRVRGVDGTGPPRTGTYATRSMAGAPTRRHSRAAD